MIDDIEVLRLQIPLSEPYRLALGDVVHFDTVLVRLTAGERVGLGEATILTGYTDETIEDSWRRAKAMAEGLAGSSAAAARAQIDRQLAGAPFTRTAFVSAIEMSEGHPVLSPETEARVPLLAGLNATEPAGIERAIETACGAGYGSLKVKVGFDATKDLARVAFIQRCNGGRMRLRLDGNQGYSQADAIRFATALDPSSIELLEQPCDAADWGAAQAVAKVSAVPLMMDELIYGFADIGRAAEIGAKFVKLKLMKMGSLTALEAGLERIRALEMEPVLGNGVASDIGCWMEACVALKHIRNAGEMNGFLRQRSPLARPPMRMERGALVVGPGRAPQLSADAIDGFTIERAHFGAGRRGPGEMT